MNRIQILMYTDERVMVIDERWVGPGFEEFPLRKVGLNVSALVVRVLGKEYIRHSKTKEIDQSNPLILQCTNHH